MPNQFLGMYGVNNLSALLGEGLSRRASTLFSAVTLVSLLGLALAVLWPAARQEEEDSVIFEDQMPESHRFAAVLVVVGAALVFV